MFFTCSRNLCENHLEFFLHQTRLKAYQNALFQNYSEFLHSSYNPLWYNACGSSEILNLLKKTILRLTNSRKNNPSTEKATKFVTIDNKNNCLLDFIFKNVDLKI